MNDGIPYELKCPICGSVFNHPSIPYPLQGDDDRKEGWEERGRFHVIIPFKCENDHKWKIFIRFHGGTCTIEFQGE